MDISIYPVERCEASPTRAHVFEVYSGSVWKCEYCWKAKWNPVDWAGAEEYAKKIKIMGLDRAYAYFVNQSHGIKKMMEQLEELRLLKIALPEKEFRVASLAILGETNPAIRKVQETINFPDLFVDHSYEQYNPAYDK